MKLLRALYRLPHLSRDHVAPPMSSANLRASKIRLLTAMKV